MEEIAVSVKGFSKSFGKKDVLSNLNLNIKKGEIVAILGPSGKGKSVLIKSIIGFYKPTAGSISYGVASDKVNFSMQHNSIYDSLTVRQNWKYFSNINGVRWRDRNKVIKDLLSSMGLSEYENVLVRNLSGGTKKRVDIGCSLLNNPDVLVLDEPFAGLDRELINNLEKYILLLNKQGKTIIIVSHRIKLISRICSRILLLKSEGIKEIPQDKLWEHYDELE